jgi:hypothetical protein
MTNAENIGAPAAKAVKKKASGSSFYIAMRLMPAEERDAMFAIYAFCRKVDDIADDGVGTRSQRHEKLEQWREDLKKLYAGNVAQQVRFLAPAVTRYGLRLDDFLAVLDGMDMDVARMSSRPISPPWIFIAIGSPALLAAFRSRCSAWRKVPASSWRIIWAAPCN